MRDHLILNLDGPMQAWGGEAFDSRRPTRAFPGRSALAGLLANALGWSYVDDEATTSLQSSLRHAVVAIHGPVVIRDYATADLSPPSEPDAGLAFTRYGRGPYAQGWTTRDDVVRRGGARSSVEGRNLMDKFFLANGRLLVAIGVADGGPVSVDALAEALRQPKRPLYLGRRSCPPASFLLLQIIRAESPVAALRAVELPEWSEPRPAWADAEDILEGRAFPVWDQRRYGEGRFAGERQMVEGKLTPTTTGSQPQEAS
jgi:CRISPR system Cascade subunit CasD